MSRRMILSSSSDEDADMPILSKTTTVKSEGENIVVKEENIAVKEEKETTVVAAKSEKTEVIAKNPKPDPKPKKGVATKKGVKDEEKEEEEESDAETTTKKPKRATTKRNASTKPTRGRGKKAKIEEEGEEEDGEASGTTPNDDDPVELNDACEEDITNFKPGQTKPTPSPGCGDRVFYETLYKQNPDSFMALKYCVEYGVFPQRDAEAMFKKLLFRKEQMKLDKK